MAAAFAASSPNVAFLPEGCDTRPFSTVISCDGTCQSLAAAAISMARAVAPARR